MFLSYGNCICRERALYSHFLFHLMFVLRNSSPCSSSVEQLASIALNNTGSIYGTLNGYDLLINSKLWTIHR